MGTRKREDAGVVRVARRVLASRLKELRGRMSRAFAALSDDPELIHKLRVEVRRVSAAVGVFAAWLPRKDVRRARQLLRTIRRAAGEARDWDVFAATVSEWAASRPEIERPGLDALLGWSAAKRHVAQARLNELAEEYPGEIDRLRAELKAAVRPPGRRNRQTLDQLVRQRVSERTAELDAAIDVPTVTDVEMHRVRIAAKRVRYTAEVLDEWLPDGQGDFIYPQLKRVQESLGLFNDATVGLAILSDFDAHIRRMQAGEWERFRTAVTGLSEHFTNLQARSRVSFRDWQSTRPVWEERDRAQKVTDD